MNPPRRAVGPAVILAAATAASFAYFVWLHRGFTLLTYPFKFPDSWVWLVEARWYLGDDVPPAFLAPLTPLTLAGLMKLGLDDAIPFRALFFHHLLGPIVFAWTLSGTGSPRTALAAGLLCLTSASMLGNALYIGSDVAANAFFLMSAFSFWLGMKRGRGWLWVSAVCLGISANTQYAAFFLPAPFGAYLLLRDRRRLLDGRVWASLTVALLLACAQFAYRRFVSGGWFTSRAQYVSLVRPNVDALGPYAWWTIGFFSVPIGLLALVGLWELICKPQWRDFGALVVLVMLTMIGFFVFLYSWADNRFIQYWAAPTFMLAAVGLRRLFYDLFDPLPPGPVVSGPAPAGATPAAPPPKRRPALWQRGLFLGLGGVALGSNGLSRSWPFSNEVVPAPGLAIDLKSQLLTDPPTLRMDLTPQRDRRRFNLFYYSHAQAVRRLQRDGQSIPCTFNAAVSELEPVARAAGARLAAGDAIALASDPNSRHVERHTLSFLTHRAVVLWEGVAKLDDADGRRVGLVVEADDAGAAPLPLVAPGATPTVITLHENEHVTQRLQLPTGARGLRLLTGTFNEENVELRFSLRRTDQPEPPVAVGVLRLRNNEYSVAELPEGGVEPGAYYLSLANRTPRDAALYVNREFVKPGWLLVGPDGAQATGQIVLDAVAGDPDFAQRLKFVERFGRFSLWTRRTPASQPTTEPAP